MKTTFGLLRAHVLYDPSEDRYNALSSSLRSLADESLPDILDMSSNNIEEENESR